MRGERGQVTLFAIIGIVLVLIVGLFFLLTREDAPTPASEDVNAAVLSTYLSSCIDTVFNDEIRAFAIRGGAPEDTSAFPHATIDDAGRSLTVIFGLLPDANAYPPPKYPTNITGLTNSMINEKTNVPFGPTTPGYFGDVTLPAICSTTGPNRPGQPISCTYQSSAFTYPNNPSKTPNPATQSELESRIAQRVQGCAAKTAFEKAIGKDVTVENPKVSITFTSDATILSLTYPITIEGESTAKLSTFQRSYRVRYLAIAQFATDLTLRESQDVLFSISDDYASLGSYRQGFSITRKQDIALRDSTNPGLKADLISIADANSLIDGESLRFLFLIAHRPPMLDKLTPTQYANAYRGESVVINGADPDDGLVQIVICPGEGSVPARCSSLSPKPAVFAIDADGEKDWEELLVY